MFLTTHYLEEADQLSDRLAIIDHGRIIADGGIRLSVTDATQGMAAVFGLLAGCGVEIRAASFAQPSLHTSLFFRRKLLVAIAAGFGFTAHWGGLVLLLVLLAVLTAACSATSSALGMNLLPLSLGPAWLRVLGHLNPYQQAMV